MAYTLTLNSVPMSKAELNPNLLVPGMRQLRKSTRMTNRQRNDLIMFDAVHGWRRAIEIIGVTKSTYYNILNNGTGREDNVALVIAATKGSYNPTPFKNKAVRERENQILDTDINAKKLNAQLKRKQKKHAAYEMRKAAAANPDRNVPLVAVRDTITGQEFLSIAEAASFYKIKYGKLREWLSGKSPNPTALERVQQKTQ